MTAEMKLPDNHPMMVAWEKYRATEEAKTSDAWARHVEVSQGPALQGQIIVSHPHTTGSLWASFVAGYEAACSDEQVTCMVDRFLSWKLPQPWHPDNGISYARPNYAHPPADHDWPTGTNLFDATQARAMVKHMMGLPEAKKP